MNKTARLLTIASALFFAACGGGGSSDTYSVNETASSTEILKLTAIVDGDTLDFGAKRCRLNGIDTPEKYAGTKLTSISTLCGVDELSIQILGEAATTYAATLLQIGSYYEVDTIGQDIYGRDVCLVGTQYGDFGGLMVNAGYAVVLEQYMSAGYNLSYYLAGESDAKTYSRALWGVNDPFMQCMTEQ